MRYPSVRPDSLPPRQALLFTHPLEEENTHFSPDRAHRYTLFRVWGEPSPYCAFVLTNPSSADEVYTDRTVSRCIAFADFWGYSAIYILNAFALRSTSPEVLYSHPNPIGADNDRWIRKVVAGAHRVVLGWGNHPVALGRSAAVEQILKDACPPEKLFCLGRNDNGSPMHPLTRGRFIKPQDITPYAIHPGIAA